MRKVLIGLSLVLPLAVGVVGCASSDDVTEQVQSAPDVYSRVYDVDAEELFPKVIKALLVSGYSVQTSDAKAGFVSARSAVVSTSPMSNVLTAVSVQQVTVASVFVEEASGGTKVEIRLVRQEQVTGESGSQANDQTKITNAEMYRELFNLIAQLAGQQPE